MLRLPRPLQTLLLPLAILPALFAAALAHEPTSVPIADLTCRIAGHPDSTILYLERGELRRITGDLEGARADYRQVERLEPGNPRLPICRAALALDIGEAAEARRLLDAALGVRPADPEVLELRARALRSLGEQAAAIADLSAAITLLEHPSPDLFLARARLQVTGGDVAEARKGLDEARARIGAAASLELFAIELDLDASDPARARVRLADLEARAADRSAFAVLAARIDAAGGAAVDAGDGGAAGARAKVPATPAGLRPVEPLPTPRPVQPAIGTAVTPILPRHGLWRYNATGVDLGTSWRQSSYPDTAWLVAQGVLGYGEPYVGGVVPYGPDPLNRYPTTYFRTSFVMPTPLPAIVSLTMNAEFDDGIVVYLNGVEAARRSIASGTVGYSSLALSHEAGAYETIDLSGAKPALVAGTNVLAVEVHQASVSSSDLVWDADLAYSDLPHLTRGPYLQMGSDSAITVRWRTSAATDARVLVGTSPSTLVTAASFPTLLTEHELRVTGLDPATRYYYAVGTATDVLAGDSSYTFRTGPPAGVDAPVRAWVLGDSGQPGALANLVRDAYAEWCGSHPTDLWLMLGDNAYSNGTDSEYQTAVFDEYPVMLRQSTLWPTRGNHDVLHSGINNDYYDLFTMPSAAEAGGLLSGTEAYYSFNWANVHFICLDSEGSDKTPSGAMMTWLTSDLAANTRRWVIAFWHYPPYSKGSHDSDSESGLVAMRQYANPILEAGGVDLVLCGHSHAYERSFLLDGHYGTSTTLTPDMIVDGRDGRPDGSGPYVKPVDAPSPHAGAVYAVSGSGSHASGGALNHPVMVTSLNVCGSMVLDIHGDRLDARFLDLTGAVRDSFAIVKNGIAGVGSGATPAVRLLPAMPNPFHGDLRMGYVIDRPGRVRVSLYDLSGRRVAVVDEGWRDAGAHDLRWDGRDAEGRPIPNGVYLAVLEARGQRSSRKLALVR